MRVPDAHFSGVALLFTVGYIANGVSDSSDDGDTPTTETSEPTDDEAQPTTDRTAG